MTKLDLYREHKAEYSTPEKTAVITVGPAKYLAIEGKGVPGSEAFQGAIGALYSVAYTMKMKLKAKQDHSVCKLEGQYWVDGGDWAGAPQENWQWRLLIRTPDFVTERDLHKTIQTLLAKGKPEEVANVTLVRLNEGSCLQVLHTGPYSSEPVTITAMLKLAAEKGYSLSGTHHEIYLSDPRRVPPEKLRTILRLPVTRNSVAAGFRSLVNDCCAVADTSSFGCWTNRSRAGRNAVSPLFPIAMETFRRKPEYFARQTGVWRNCSRNSISVSEASSSSGGANERG